MSRCNNCGPQALDRARAEATAAALIAQGRAVSARSCAAAQGAPPMELDDMPMNRYIFPRPGAQNSPEYCSLQSCWPGGGETLDRVLETLCCQNQLLVDILGAINALTAALLSAQCQR